jgi:transcriptional regulator with XRE-family HTH domain
MVCPMPVRIGPKRQRQVYLAEWRVHLGITQEQLAQRIGKTAMTVSRWERGETQMNKATMDAVAEALKGDMEGEDLYYHPERPSPNMLLRGQPPEIIDQAIKLIKAIRR